MNRNSKPLSQIETLFESPAMVAVDKPAGVIVIPDQHTPTGETVLGALEARYGTKVYVVHRIDRDTTGVLVFAKNADAHRDLSLQFERGEVRKAYLALVDGRVPDDAGVIDVPIRVEGRDVSAGDGGKEAETHYRVLERFRAFTLVEAEPRTGRRHQIRLHFQSLGHPLAVDAEHGTRSELMLSFFKRHYKSNGKEFPLMARLTLHAARLVLRDPATAGTVAIESPLPKDFAVLLKQLRKYNAA